MKILTTKAGKHGPEVHFYAPAVIGILTATGIVVLLAIVASQYLILQLACG